jgi:tetratricopeptide (TPR) repeat protein
MRTALSLLTFSILLSVGLSAQPVSSREKKTLAADLVAHGNDQMEIGEYESAVDDYLRARKLDPQNQVTNVRLAQAWYMMGEFSKSANAVKGLLRSRQSTPQAFQVYGNAMDMLGKGDYAEKMYKEGLKKFPQAGILHMELGIMRFSMGQLDSALFYWENGIEAEPWFASNYYWAAKACDTLGDRLWASLYAELYLNIDRTSDRSSEMGALIFSSFRRSIAADSEGMPIVKMTDMPYRMTKSGKPFEQHADEAYTLARSTPDHDFTVENLIEWWDFYHHFWFNNRDTQKLPLSLYAWHQLIDKSGFLEAYHHWLLYDAAPNEFSAWVADNEGYWQQFEEWFRMNSLSMLGHGAICRRQFW